MTMRVTSTRSFFYCAIALITLSFSSCGDDSGNQRSADSLPNRPVPAPAIDDAIVKGRWELEMTSSGENLSFGMLQTTKGSATQTISGVVAANVKFTVVSTNFSTPPATGLASYGTLNITSLSDNALRVCGAQGNQKCTEGEIRVFTSGSPGAGLWSAVEGYGLPITTGTATVGLNATEAASIKKVAILGNTRVLKLSDFAAGNSLDIPFNVDFTDAAAGNYSTTLNIEYVVR